MCKTGALPAELTAPPSCGLIISPHPGGRTPLCGLSFYRTSAAYPVTVGRPETDGDYTRATPRPVKPLPRDLTLAHGSTIASIAPPRIDPGAAEAGLPAEAPHRQEVEQRLVGGTGFEPVTAGV